MEIIYLSTEVINITDRYELLFMFHFGTMKDKDDRTDPWKSDSLKITTLLFLLLLQFYKIPWSYEIAK